MLDEPFKVNSCSKCINHKTKGLSQPCRTCLIDSQGNKLNFDDAPTCINCVYLFDYNHVECETCDYDDSEFKAVESE